MSEDMNALTKTKSRPRTLTSRTYKLRTTHGNLYVIIAVDENGAPFEVFGFYGKAGSFERGVAELVCRLVSLHLRRGTPISEIIDQMSGISEMQPSPNQLPDGSVVSILGLGDGIAHLLREYCNADVQDQSESHGEKEGPHGFRAERGSVVP